MSPVMKDTPRSYWLLQREEKEEAPKVPDEKTRVPNMLTSIWLASTSTEPLTCVTISNNNNKKGVEWPSILFRDSPDLWLAEREHNNNNNNKAVNPLDSWLAKNNSGPTTRKDNNNVNDTSFLDGWLSSFSQEDSDDISVWLSKAGGVGKADEESLVEKWLCLAVSGEEDQEEDALMDDEASSIGILDEEEDFHIVGEAKKESVVAGRNIWLI